MTWGKILPKNKVCSDLNLFIISVNLQHSCENFSDSFRPQPAFPTMPGLLDQQTPAQC